MKYSLQMPSRAQGKAAQNETMLREVAKLAAETGKDQTIHLVTKEGIVEIKMRRLTSKL